MRQNKDFREYYEIIKIIGQGTYGSVYKAKLKNTNEYRAIKMIDINKIKAHYISEHFSEPSEEDLKKYIDLVFGEMENMKIAEGKNKENINTVKFYEYFYTKNEFAIVIELCDENLSNIIRRKKEGFTEEEIYEILIQLNNTFEIMSENKIILRDIKLNNILIKYIDKEKSKYIAKIGDYGVSKRLSDWKFENKVGDPHYMAPEIIKEENYDIKCDLWSLGILIYILYFKEYPFKGHTEIEVFNQIQRLKDKILKKNTRDPDLDDLIKKLLTAEPKLRIGWKEYFEHPFFRKRMEKKNIKDNKEKKILKYQNVQKDITINANSDDISQLKKELAEEKTKSLNLSKRITELEKEIKEEKNKNKILEEKIMKLNIELKDEIKKNEIIKKANKEIDSKGALIINILEKDKEIKDLKAKLSRFPFEIKENEKLMSLIFSSADQRLHYSIICKNTDIFCDIERKLYEDNKEFYETINFFTNNGKNINKYKSLEENNIKNNDIIILNTYDNE